MNIVYMKMADIKPYENNPRNNEAAVPYVKNSIREFGFKVPILIDADNVIVCGHTRYKAAQELGYDEVPCVYADNMSEEQIKAFRLVDNKTHEDSKWDFSKLNEELEGIFDIDMEDFGFTDISLSAVPETQETTEHEARMVVCPKCGTQFEA